jgi:predicted metal-dependent hydrolase
VTKKNQQVVQLIAPFTGQEWDAHYLAYFACFNREQFFEAHDVLEELWLARGDARNHAFYKGLIQLAGAFVHLQKGRLRPAASVLKLAATNLSQYTPAHEGLDVEDLMKLIEDWLRRLEGGGLGANPLAHRGGPKLRLPRGCQGKG